MNLKIMVKNSTFWVTSLVKNVFSKYAKKTLSFRVFANLKLMKLPSLSYNIYYIHYKNNSNNIIYVSVVYMMYGWLLETKIVIF